jgi:predicted nucleotidyltransferase component of viral defense system
MRTYLNLANVLNTKVILFYHIGKYMINTIDEKLIGEKLKKAQLQDLAIRAIFESVNDAVFHGGTAVWRCYNGKRFSKDIDMYIYKEKSIDKIASNLLLYGLRVKKGDKRRLMINYIVSGNGTDIALQFVKKRCDGISIPYTNTNGTMLTVYSLSDAELILEKIVTYGDRRLERDIYDIMVLTQSLSNKNLVVDELKEFLKDLKEPVIRDPLKNLIYEGISPSFDQIVRYLKMWCGV